MASAVDSRLAYARLSAVATASRLPTANRGSNNSYTTSWDTTPLRPVAARPPCEAHGIGNDPARRPPYTSGGTGPPKRALYTVAPGDHAPESEVGSAEYAPIRAAARAVSGLPRLARFFAGCSGFQRRECSPASSPLRPALPRRCPERVPAPTAPVIPMGIGDENWLFPRSSTSENPTI